MDAMYVPFQSGSQSRQECIKDKSNKKKEIFNKSVN